MPDPTTKSQLKGLRLSAVELKDMTNWSGSLVEDYLNKTDNLDFVSDTLDDEIDRLLEETATEFLNGTVPFVNDGFLAEDNANFFWDNVAKILKLKALILNGIAEGSVMFAGADGLMSQDNDNLFWDDTNNRLGIGTATPLAQLHTTEGRIVGTTRIINTDSPYTVLVTDHSVFCDTDGGDITDLLPAGIDGTDYRIANVGTSGNTLTLSPNGSELLLGLNSDFFLLDGDVLHIQYETTEGWF